MATDDVVIRNAVIHLTNEQPLLADMYENPGPGDTLLVCTNLRTMGGKRPVFADHSASLFYFPFSSIRFLEIPPGADSRRPAVDVKDARRAASQPEAEADLEIDEDLLRRVRDA